MTYIHKDIFNVISVQYGCQEKNGLFSDRLERTLCEINSRYFYQMEGEKFKFGKKHSTLGWAKIDLKAPASIC